MNRGLSIDDIDDGTPPPISLYTQITGRSRDEVIVRVVEEVARIKAAIKEANDAGAKQIMVQRISGTAWLSLVAEGFDITLQIEATALLAYCISWQ